ncbi:hypothetical protein ACIPPN_30830 [Streptomyces diastaticus]|uniref:DUF3592 domain-containing protein n=1 Tax=Streptomyces rutgersensis TaxID=53451 RepID=A0ABX6RY23_9ACTN|nr:MULTISPECIES: hypothetical protein [Streptomyces]QNE85159.1 hypothetical protein F0345_29255 [Streptomyces rutgersensis]RPK82578.1 hypothetical protein EES47_25965 [Streptomyces sp. ADI98-12]
MLDLVLASLALAIPAGLLMLRRGVRRPPPWHKQPVALLGVTLVSGSLTVMVWGFGIFSGGLDVRETCELTRHTTYDQEWRNRTGADGTSYFPLVNACNEHVNLVPAWVNPVIIVLAVLAVSALILALLRVASAILHRKELVSS